MKLESVPFNVTIKKGFNTFIGRITEEVEFGGIDDEILIMGKLTGYEIEFTKYYKLEHTVDDSNNYYAEPSDNPTTVYYKGVYNPDLKKFTGQWEIPQLREAAPDVMNVENTSGYWEMWQNVK